MSRARTFVFADPPRLTPLGVISTLSRIDSEIERWLMLDGFRVECDNNCGLAVKLEFVHAVAVVCEQTIEVLADMEEQWEIDARAIAARVTTWTENFWIAKQDDEDAARFAAWVALEALYVFRDWRVSPTLEIPPALIGQDFTLALGRDLLSWRMSTFVRALEALAVAWPSLVRDEHIDAYVRMLRTRGLHFSRDMFATKIDFIDLDVYAEDHGEYRVGNAAFKYLLHHIMTDIERSAVRRREFVRSIVQRGAIEPLTTPQRTALERWVLLTPEGGTSLSVEVSANVRQGHAHFFNRPGMIARHEKSKTKWTGERRRAFVLKPSAVRRRAGMAFAALYPDEYNVVQNMFRTYNTAELFASSARRDRPSEACVIYILQAFAFAYNMYLSQPWVENFFLDEPETDALRYLDVSRAYVVRFGTEYWVMRRNGFTARRTVDIRAALREWLTVSIADERDRHRGEDLAAFARDIFVDGKYRVKRSSVSEVITETPTLTPTGRTKKIKIFSG